MVGTADTENGASYNLYPMIHFQYQLSQGSESRYKIHTGHDFTPNLHQNLPNKSPINKSLSFPWPGEWGNNPHPTAAAAR